MPSAQQRFATLTLALLFVSLAALAQEPPGESYPPISDPVNLKVLPKGLATYSLVQIMKQYRAELGVKCGYCHADHPATHKLDFASDAKAEKKTARVMMTMTDELNSKYIGNPPTGSDVKVTCGTCHRGHRIPEEYVPPDDPPEKH